MNGRSKTQRRRVVSLHSAEASAAPPPMRLGRVTGWSEADGIVVDYAGSPSGPQPARTTMRLSAEQIQMLVASGETVLLAFEPGGRPILFGLTQPIPPPPGDQEATRAVVDGEMVEIRGAERVELRCGKASILLTKEGKILLNGTYLASESTGAHRIRGGSVEIN